MSYNEGVEKIQLMNPIRRKVLSEGSSIKEMASELDVSPGSIYHWIKGESCPTHGNRKKVATYLGLSVGEFIYEWRQWEEGI